jgi:OPA family glycerol-3-phosphate transporter-like MFS transporter
MIFWAVMDWIFIKNTPEEAMFPPFDTHDASSGHMDIDFTTAELLKKVFTNPLMLTFAFIELTTGVLRNGIYQWYFIFAYEIKQPGAEFFLENWGLLLCVFGIIGGFLGGLISDNFFQIKKKSPGSFSIRFYVYYDTFDGCFFNFVTFNCRFCCSINFDGCYRCSFIDVRDCGC